MNIYVGNLPYRVTDQELRQTFEAHGAVESAEVIVDRRTRRSRGYGFVVMTNDDEAIAAISALNGSDLGGRELRVDESQPKKPEANGSDAKPRRRATKGNERRSAARPASAPATASNASGLFGFFRKLVGR